MEKLNNVISINDDIYLPTKEVSNCGRQANQTISLSFFALLQLGCYDRVWIVGGE